MFALLSKPESILVKFCSLDFFCKPLLESQFLLHGFCSAALSYVDNNDILTKRKKSNRRIIYRLRAVILFSSDRTLSDIKIMQIRKVNEKGSRLARSTAGYRTYEKKETIHSLNHLCTFVLSPLIILIKLVIFISPIQFHWIMPTQTCSTVTDLFVFSIGYPRLHCRQ